MRILAIALALVGAAACAHHDGGGNGDGGIQGLASLAVTPADQTLTVTPNVPATSTYTVTGTFSDGHTEDVTAQVTLTVANPDVGAFSAALFTSSSQHGGASQIVATSGTITGSTTVTVMFTASETDPSSTGLPANPQTLFGGSADAARDPSLVYPNNGVLVPPNLGKLEFHFVPGAANTVFDLTFANSVTQVDVYLGCPTPMGSGCIYQPDDTVWAWLSQTNRGGDPVTWSIRGTDSTGTAVGASGSASVQFAPDDTTGGIYYWTTTTEAIMRYDFAGTQGSATEYVGTELENTCIGCHALSHDGTKLVAEVNGQNDGRTALVNVATKTVMNDFGQTPLSTFETWNPDGTLYAGVYADTNATNYNLMLLSGSDSTLVQTIDVGGTAAHPTDHPDWSPDGTRIAFVRVGTAGTLQRMWNGSIYQVTGNGSAWGTPSLLVPATNGLENDYYPAYAPDNRLVVFDRATCTSGSATGVECYADTSPSATLMAVDSITPGAPVVLANANAPGIADGATTQLTNSFPKWNPFVFAKNNAGGHLGWITFSSKRQYGLRSPPSGGGLLWMAAVDLDAPDGSDPSFTAFALPFQDITTSNHIAQWTMQVVQVQ